MKILTYNNYGYRKNKRSFFMFVNSAVADEIPRPACTHQLVYLLHLQILSSFNHFVTWWTV